MAQPADADNRLEASLYRTDLRDAIIFGSNSRPQRGLGTINGFEAALKQELFGWQSNLGVAIIDPATATRPHPGAPCPRTLSLDLDRQFDRLGLGASWQAVSGSYDDLNNQQPWVAMPCWACVAAGSSIARSSWS
jgi:vitamin B12 transporter